MLKYRTEAYSCEIKAVEVERETEKSVFVKGSRSAKKSDYWQFWDSFEEAKEYLLDKSHGKVESAKFKLECAESFLSKVEKLTCPSMDKSQN